MYRFNDLGVNAVSKTPLSIDYAKRSYILYKVTLELSSHISPPSLCFTSSTSPTQSNSILLCSVQLTLALFLLVLSQAGPVVNVHLPKDRVSQTHQGFGFCEFQTEEDADYACKIMNQIKLFGKPIRVNKVSRVGYRAFCFSSRK